MFAKYSKNIKNNLKKLDLLFLQYWIMAMFLLGIVMTNLQRGSILREALFLTHKSFGLVFVVSFVLSLFIRVISRLFYLKESKKFSLFKLTFVYLGFCLPITGILLLFFKSRPLLFFDFFEIESPLKQNLFLHEVFEFLHQYIAYFTGFLIFYSLFSKIFLKKMIIKLIAKNL